MGIWSWMQKPENNWETSNSFSGGGSSSQSNQLDGRITVASMATEMGVIITFFPPSEEVVEHCRAAGASFNTE